jgi:hypothetical protein
MTTTDIERRAESALAETRAEPLRRLDPYGQGGIAAQAGRVAPLAIVSLGFRQPPKADGQLGLPRASRREDDKWLHLHDPDGRAPGLKAALEAGKHRRLRIAFPMDHGFIQQSFTRWSASALEIYGNAGGLYLIDGRDPKSPQHRFVPPDHVDFPRLVKTCKAETRLHFVLARWLPAEDGGAPASEVIFPDGFGSYVFRTAGRHTAANIFGYLESISTFTNGRIAGIPFDLDVVFPEVVGPDGKKRTVATATIVMRPPEQIKLNSRTFRQLATAGLEEGRNLQLPALPSPSELALEGPPDIEDIPAEAAERARAGDYSCDYNMVVRTWHAIVRGTPLESDESRALWLNEWSRGEFDSLTAVRNLTQREATQMLADLADDVSDVREDLLKQEHAANAARLSQIMGTEEDLYDPIGAAAQRGKPKDDMARPETEGSPERGEALLAETHDAQGETSGRSERAAEQGDGVEDAGEDSDYDADLAEALKKNALLLEDARSLDVKGLTALTAKQNWPLHKVEEANRELLARIRNRNNELDQIAARDATAQQEGF